MKKLIVMLMTILFATSTFAMEVVATTYQTNLKPSDMVEIFVEELNRSAYRYQVADYKVYTASEKQSYAWAVKIDTEGYRNDTGGHTYERSIFLHMKNGYVCLKTFGGPTITNLKSCIDVNEETSKVRDSLYDAIYSYTKESKTWLKRYNKNYREDEIEALDMLNNVSFFLTYYISQNTFKKDYYIVQEDSLIDNCVKANDLSWNVYWYQDEELLDFCKRYDCLLHRAEDGSDYVDPKSIKKSKLEKLKKENNNIYVYSTYPNTIYKVQDDKVMYTKVYLQFYMSIDDMLLEDYQKVSFRYVDESGNVIYER